MLELYDRLVRGGTLRIGEIVESMRISERQAQRDVAIVRGRLALEQAPDGGWRLTREGKQTRERQTSRAQLLAIELGVKLSESLWQPSRMSAIQTRVDRLRGELTPWDETRLARWRQRVAVVAPGQKDYRGRKDASRVLDQVLEAMVEMRPVSLSYRSHRRVLAKQPGRMLTVHPLGIVFYRDGVYFIVDVVGGAPDLLDKRILLSLDRIEVTGLGAAGSFVVPARFSAQAFFADAFGIWRDGEPRRVVLEVTAEHAPWFKERLFHPSQSIEERTDGSLKVEIVVAGTQELVDWALSLGDHAQVVEPRELREAVRDRLRVALSVYEGGDIFRRPADAPSPVPDEGRRTR